MAYDVTGVHTVPTYLKWMLVFEEPETRKWPTPCCGKNTNTTTTDTKPEAVIDNAAE